MSKDKKENQIADWAVITTNSAQPEFTDVTRGDIADIINSLKKLMDVELWTQSVNGLYDHLSDMENPHELTKEQLLETVFDRIYLIWLEEGYRGSKDELRFILYRYLDIAVTTDMEAETSTIHITPVKVVADYLKSKHDLNQDAHSNTIGKFFSGDPIDKIPSFSINSNIGAPTNYADTSWFNQHEGTFIVEAGLKLEDLDYCFGFATEDIKINRNITGFEGGLFTDTLPTLTRELLSVINPNTNSGISVQSNSNGNISLIVVDKGVPLVNTIYFTDYRYKYRVVFTYDKNGILGFSSKLNSLTPIIDVFPNSERPVSSNQMMPSMTTWSLPTGIARMSKNLQGLSNLIYYPFKIVEPVKLMTFLYINDLQAFPDKDQPIQPEEMEAIQIELNKVIRVNLAGITIVPNGYWEI